ncbi:hypothetical protein Tco_1205090 [Tanacetum coccineum]
MWNILKSIIKDAGKDSLGVAIGTSKTHTARRESWWLCEEVQSKVAMKQARFRELLSCQEGNQEERFRAHERYKKQEAKREAKKLLAQAKEKAYKKMDFKEGANDIFRIEKARERRRMDLGDICFIKDEGGDAQVCSNYSGIKLLNHTIKLWERVIERRLRRETMVFENQFGFMPERSSIEAIHLIRSIIEKYKERQRDLHLAFTDLEKAYNSEDIPWCLIFVDDIVLVLESTEGLNNRLENWRETLEDNGLRVSQEKTKYLRCDFVAIRPSMLYGLECWPVTKALANRMEVAELRMLSGDYHRQDKIREERLRWFGHVRIRPQPASVKIVEALVVDGLRRMGRPKLWWEDRVKLHIKELLLSDDTTSDINEWRGYN